MKYMAQIIITSPQAVGKVKSKLSIHTTML